MPGQDGAIFTLVKLVAAGNQDSLFPGRRAQRREIVKTVKEYFADGFR